MAVRKTKGLALNDGLKKTGVAIHAVIKIIVKEKILFAQQNVLKIRLALGQNYRHLKKQG